MTVTEVARPCWQIDTQEVDAPCWRVMATWQVSYAASDSRSGHVLTCDAGPTVDWLVRSKEQDAGSTSALDRDEVSCPRCGCWARVTATGGNSYDHWAGSKRSVLDARLERRSAPGSEVCISAQDGLA